MLKFNYRLISFLLLLIIFSCSDEVDNQAIVEDIDSNSLPKINLQEQLNIDSGEVKMFTMPTPLQIATALKVMNVDYNESLLLEKNNISATASDIDLSLALGMYLTDLGYTTAYNNPQQSLNYAKDIQYIMEELPITMYVNDGFRKRFENNIEKPDSLSKIILEGYNDANQYITETENEGLGLLILTGAYIEGLYLASSSNISNIWLEEHNNLYIQQKLFLDNFLILLDGYTSNPKIASVIEELSKLKEIFDEINIQYNNKTESYELTNAITPSKRSQVNDKITMLRNDLARSFNQ